MKLLKILSIVLIFTMFGCGQNTNNKQDTQSENTKEQENVKTNIQEEEKQTSEKPDTSFESVAKNIVLLLKNKDFNKLTNFSCDSVRFSPFPNLNDKNIILKTNNLSNLINIDTLFIWGIHPASGENIKLNFNDYYNKYIFDVDFSEINPKLNKPINTNNLKNNIKEIYPDSYVAEYHFEGTDKYEKMDWKTLYLIFVKKENNYKLKAIIHNTWLP